MVIATALIITGCYASSSSPHHSTASAFPWRACPQNPTLTAVPLRPGQRPSHQGEQARAVADVAGLAPTEAVSVYAAVVHDTTAPKLGLGPADVPRVMWVIEGEGPSRATEPLPTTDPRRTLFRLVALVDDATLRFGGGFGCGPVPRSTTTRS